MEFGHDWYELGYCGLFLVCFLAATVLPLSSEALFLGFLLLGFNPLTSWLVASTGNWLGGLSCYAIGYFLPLERIPSSICAQDKLSKWINRLGRTSYYWAALCWLPIVGDVIAVALGAIRSSLVLTAIIMLIAKAIRYAVIGRMVIGTSLEFT